MATQPTSAAPTDPAVQVTIGVDTHRDLHVAVALDQQGRWLGTRSFPTTPAGCAALTTWATQYGALGPVGIEGTGSYGAGLARWLRARGRAVVEIDRPDRRDRQGRRRRGKSDPTDAEAAARAVLAGTAVGQPKAADGQVEMIRLLRVARRSALKARTQAANQLHALVLTAPDPLRARLRGLTLERLVAGAAAFRPGSRLTTPLAATRLALKSSRGATSSSALKSLPSMGSWPRSSPRQPRRWWQSRASGRRPPAPCSWPPATTPTGCGAKAPLPGCVGSRRCPPPRAGPPDIDSTVAVIATPTGPSICWSSAE